MRSDIKDHLDNFGQLLKQIINKVNKMKSIKSALACIVLAFAGMTQVAYAGGTTGTMTVSSTVQSGCTINSTGTINMVYDPLSAVPTTGSTAGSLLITCSGGTVWGVYSDTSVATRIMSYIGTQTLPAAMYAMPYALSNSEGTGLAVTDTTGKATGVGNGAPQPVFISATVAPKLNIAVGQYSQVISLVVVY